MIDYNNISYILKDVLGTNDISEKSLKEALLITYKDWKINKLRQEQQSIRQSLNTMCKTFYIQCLHSGINIYDIMKELNMKNKHEVEEYLHIDNR